MAGYTPVFDTVFNGTLCGKWPVLPVWLTLLPLADWRGHIDMTPEAIAARTGWPMELLLEGIEALCQPDPRSRSKGEDGRRLVLIDAERPWGWRVVNIAIYREKASGANQVADGRNAEKVRRYKERHRKTPADTTGHQIGHQGDTHSYSNTYSDKEKKKQDARQRRAKRVPEEFSPDLEFARREIPDIDAEREARRFKDHQFKVARSDWPAVWRTWVSNCRDSGRYAKREAVEWR